MNNQQNSSVVKLDFTASADRFDESAKKILQCVRPDWNLENVQFKTFTDGITNKLMGCYLRGNFDDMVLVRINGEGSDIIIKREEELETFRVLSAAKCAPDLFCVFNNGLAYGFFPGIPLDEKTVREPKIQRLIAYEQVRLHGIRGPYADQCQGKLRSQYSERVQDWLECIPTHFDDPEKQKVYAQEIPTREELKAELNEIVETLDALDMDIVFSHNDLLLKNVIYNEKQETIRFIDYEYAFYNYEAFDIGNHFAEYAGMDEVNYDLYPTREEQLPWLRHYAEAKAISQGKSPSDVTNQDVEILYIQTNKCACAAHFFWGVWAILQAQHSLIDFDYIGYSNIRLTEYFRRKKEFFPLQIPA